jgi:hypothetical protein
MEGFDEPLDVLGWRATPEVDTERDGCTGVNIEKRGNRLCEKGIEGSSGAPL